MIVRVLKSDPRLGIKKGERYIAERYGLDPFEKVTLLKKISKANKVFKTSNPSCNQYFNEIAIEEAGLHVIGADGKLLLRLW